uniref:Integrase catalytic domain-containing protein n=1 Tax=Lotharella globosa TaxID=91324 RepID=A0A7S4DI59_9EUKA|mmetsp:Transcript_8747/g.17038  ORF Transcript_8747/g.17038 Transcript_8747/m.17038 type:complete len:1499 (-) Transcript_8747:1603-6099(-)
MIRVFTFAVKQSFAVMSLTTRKDGTSNQIPVGVRYDGNKAKFRPFHSRLRQHLYNKNIKFKMALQHAGEFKNLVYVPDQIITRIPKMGSDGLPELKPLSENDGDSQDDKKTNYDYSRQLLYNTICEQIFHAIQRSVTDKVYDIIISHNVKEGDGVTLYHKLVEIFQGKGNVSLLALYGKLFRLSMTGKLSELDSYTAEFNELTSMLKDQKQTLSSQLVSAVYLVGLSSRYQYIKDAVADDDAGLNDVNKIIERVRAHKTLKDYQCITTASQPAHFASSGPRPDNPRAERKLRCFNCRKVHVGGELKCTQPCRICNKKGHTRHGCPQRNQDRRAGIAQQTVAAAPGSIDTSMINWGLVATTPSRALLANPKLDSGAYWDLFGTYEVKDGKAYYRGHPYSNLNNSPGHVSVGDGVNLSELYSADIGNLSRVKIVQGLAADLVSVSKMCDDQDAWIFFSSEAAYRVPRASVSLPPNSVKIATRNGGLYDYDLGLAYVGDVKSKNPIEHLHQSCGHMSVRSILRAVRKGTLKHTGLESLSSAQIQRYVRSLSPCEACLKAKAACLPARRLSPDPAVLCFSKLYMDISARISPPADTAEEHYLIVMDAKSRAPWISGMASRSAEDVSAALDSILQLLRPYLRSSGRSMAISELRGDDEKSFSSGAVKRVCAKHSIKHNVQGAGCHRNSLAPLDNLMRTIQARTTAMLLHSGRPQSKWLKCLRYAAHLQRNLPSSDGGPSPMEIISGHSSVPASTKFRVWGSKVFELKRGPGFERSRKFDSRVHVGYFIGYHPEKLGYLIETDGHAHPVCRHDVFFIEDLNSLPAGSSSAISSSPLWHSSPPVDVLYPFDAEASFTPGISSTDDQLNGGDDPHGGDGVNEEPDSKQPVRRSSRARAAVEPFDPSPVPGLDRAIRASINNAANLAFVAASSIPTPRSFREALSSAHAQQWHAAIQKEYKQMDDLNVWVEIDSRKIPIDERVVMPVVPAFRIKNDANGELTKFKFRICGDGSRQIEGLQFKETYAPTVSADTFRWFCAVVVQLGWKTLSFDISGAFLHSPVEETIYIKPPYLYNLKNDSSHTWLLLKRSLYGLKQAGRNFYNLLSSKMQQLGYTCSKADRCMFFREFTQGKLILILFHVDDGAAGADDLAPIRADLQLLERFFGLTVTPLTYFLGLRLDWEHDSLRISVDNYIADLAKRFNMDNANPVQIPHSPGVDLIKHEEDLPKEKKSLYLQLVGCLIYAMTTCRPDIAWVVSRLSIFMSCPHYTHIKAARRVIAYLLSTRDKGLHYQKLEHDFKSDESDQSKISKLSHVGYFDADFAGCKVTRRSHTGFLLFHSGCLTAYKSNRHDGVALSSYGSETIAASEITRKAMFQRKLVKEILDSKKRETEHPPTKINRKSLLYREHPLFRSMGKKRKPFNLSLDDVAQSSVELIGDNHASIKAIKSGNYSSSRSKHMEVKFMHMHEEHLKGTVLFQTTPSKDNPADLLTKPVTKDIFLKHVGKLVG